MRCIVLLVAVAVAGILGGSAYIFFGLYDISATVPHWGITEAVLTLARERSIAAHSRGIVARDLSDPKLTNTGMIYYHAMCRLCHGAPGSAENELSKGLYPRPPSLLTGSVQRELGEAKMFWVVRNGLKMTGMPAFGPTHSEEELWGVVAYLKILPGVKAPAQ